MTNKVGPDKAIKTCTPEYFTKLYILDNYNLPTIPFIQNQIYKRANIHDQYGGSRQSGISASAKTPFIFLFSGEAGHQHGYKDQWESEDVFSYTGEGQINDMTFVRGNLALRDHLKNGRKVFLFIYVAKGLVRFESELEVIDFDFFQGIDRENNERTAIKFFFKRVGKQLNVPKDLLNLNLVNEEGQPYEIRQPNETERKGLVTSRVGQGAYRKSILFRWEFKCAVTNYTKKEILIASHIVPWKNSTDEERLDVDNGILLSPTYDALFDKNLISFDNNGKIILSDSLKKTDINLIGINGKEKINKLTSGNIQYLERHRSMLVDI
ncbi:HNH endonuclease [Lacibacter cauensis]|uniref:HNH endonuclease n=1 Tax=Lacibacter cauensis TaxID=510947 RepID=A0A562SNR8_9BACT|nr:HNH endonuclease [Lacibacter cauensis]TWI82971.1 HNH endonuclease [Lacibacter cauensis]